VPSIVYGLLALGLFVYTFGFGQSILSAGLTLALLILPIVIVATREALRSIPQHIREGAYACGASQWQVVSHHLLPYGLPGILTGVIIGMARAIGETAPIITIGALTFIAFLPPVPGSGEPAAGLFDWLFSPFTVMPIQIFNWTSRPDPAFHQNAAAASFVLVLMTLGMNGTGHLAALPPAQEPQVVSPCHPISTLTLPDQSAAPEGASRCRRTRRP
jgi:phosphate transport system permease protein